MDSFKKTKPLSWPNRAGYWWVIGKVYHTDKSILRLAKVEAENNDGVLDFPALIDGKWIYPNYYCESQFIPATLPELPDA